MVDQTLPEINAVHEKTKQGGITIDQKKILKNGQMNAQQNLKRQQLQDTLK